VRLRYSLAARSHISQIHSYIDERSPAAATRVIARIRVAAERLAEIPLMGRAGAVAGTREWVVTGLPYIIVYEVYAERDELVVLGVYHGAQLRPGQNVGGQ
jgi:plasmid stabilization system protein ParE